MERSARFAAVLLLHHGGSVPMNSAKTVIDSLPALLSQSIRTLSLL